MNIFNRIIVVLLLISVVVFSIVAAVNKFLNLFLWGGLSARVINSISSLNPFLTAVILIAIVAVCILILVLEFHRGKARVAKLSETEKGTNQITLKAISGRIEKSLSSVKDISSLKVKIIPGKEGITINMFSKISQDINTEGNMTSIREKAHDFATKNLGFKVIGTNLTITGFTDQNESKKEDESR